MVNSCVCFSSSPTSKPTTTLQLLATRLTRRSFVNDLACAQAVALRGAPTTARRHVSAPRRARGVFSLINETFSFDISSLPPQVAAKVNCSIFRRQVDERGSPWSASRQALGKAFCGGHGAEGRFLGEPCRICCLWLPSISPNSWPSGVDVSAGPAALCVPTPLGLRVVSRS